MRRPLVADVRLYLVTDAAERARPLEQFLAAVIDAGVGMVQLRDRSLSDKQLVEAARRFAAICRDNGALFIVNDRPDVALLVGADGAHVGQDDVQPDDVRAIAGDDFIIGLSTHTPDQIDAARATSADYIGVGPVHETPTKPGRQAAGIDLVRYAARFAGKPFFPIGGIDASSAQRVVEAGARSFSVMRAVAHAADPALAVRELMECLAVVP